MVLEFDDKFVLVIYLPPDFVLCNGIASLVFSLLDFDLFHLLPCFLALLLLSDWLNLDLVYQVVPFILKMSQLEVFDLFFFVYLSKLTLNVWNEMPLLVQIGLKSYFQVQISRLGNFIDVEGDLTLMSEVACV